MKTNQSVSNDLSEVKHTLFRSGEKFMAEHNFFSAIECFDKIIEMDPSDAAAYHQRGWAKAHTGNITGELEDWNSSIAIDSKFASAYADRSIAKITLLDYEGALQDAKRAIALEPSLKTQLQPVIENIKKDISLAVVESGNRDKKNPDVETQLQKMGNQRRDFLKQVTLVGMATMTAGLLAGCGKGKLAGGAQGVKWGMIIDLKKCVGCRACTVACKVENHTPPGVAYNVVLEKETGVYPHNKTEFIPRPCMQCQNSSCSKVCPTKATYLRDDGIVVVDYDKCIGCKYCIAACPYGARSYDFGYNYSDTGAIPWEQNPSPEYGQHRIREKHESPEGNVRKCTFCMHRIYNGMPPACAATCMGHAIYFGNLADPSAKCMVHGVNLQDMLASRSYMRLKEELGNEPRVYYLT